MSCKSGAFDPKNNHSETVRILYAATLTLKMAPHGRLSLSWGILLLQYTVASEMLMLLFTSFGVMQTASACFSQSRQCSSHQANNVLSFTWMNIHHCQTVHTPRCLNVNWCQEKY